MSAVHSYHPNTHTHGLADDCERCDQHAEHPWWGLDGENLRVLRDRITGGLPPRSVNEGKAMAALAEHDKLKEG